MAATQRMAQTYCERYPFMLEWSNVQGKTALHAAALKGNEGLVRVRILFILSVDFPWATLSSFHPIIRCLPNLCVFQMLCEMGADYDLPDNLGNTPLH